MERIEPQPSILILFTETGGTHANAARAIMESIHTLSNGKWSVDLVDVWKYARFPWRKLPRMIFWFRERQPISRWNYQNSQNQARLDRFNFLARPFLKKRLREILATKDYNLIISVHPVTTSPMVEVMPEGSEIPFIPVVTDIATRNVFWFDHRATMTVVPSIQTLNVATQMGIPLQQLKLIGVPVSEPYNKNPHNRAAICREIGLDANKPIVIVAGGKSGVGPLGEVARQIDERIPNINLLVLTGRNESLYHRLSEYNWSNSTRIFSYVNDLWRLLWAADVMVTKAGTGMTAEALSVGLPMILFHRVPYFEDANVSFLVENGAALWAPTTRMVTNAVSRWLKYPGELLAAQDACHRLAKPEAAAAIGSMCIEIAEKHQWE